MSIVRMGMAEDGKFAEGYEAIFGKRSTGEKKATPSKALKKPVAKKAAGKKAHPKKK